MSEFVWPVAVNSYAWKEALQSPPDQLLVPAQRWPVRWYTPFQENSALFHKLASTPPTYEGTLEFANQYGHLGTRSTHAGAEGADVFQDPDRFSDWKSAIAEMQTVTALWQPLTGGGPARRKPGPSRSSSTARSETGSRRAWRWTRGGAA